MTINALYNNRRIELINQEIIASNPEVVALIEASDELMEKIEDLRDEYPYVVYSKFVDGFSIALVSKLPIIHTETHFLGPRKIPAIRADLKIANKTFTVFTAHTHTPISQKNYKKRNAELQEIIDITSKITGPKIILGDLNISPWSKHFHHFLTETGMKNSMKGHGITPTWLSKLPFLSIPIDHILVSQEINVREHTVGNYIGSDHFPVVAVVNF